MTRRKKGKIGKEKRQRKFERVLICKCDLQKRGLSNLQHFWCTKLKQDSLFSVKPIFSIIQYFPFSYLSVISKSHWCLCWNVFFIPLLQFILVQLYLIRSLWFTVKALSLANDPVTLTSRSHLLAVIRWYYYREAVPRRKWYLGRLMGRQKRTLHDGLLALNITETCWSVNCAPRETSPKTSFAIASLNSLEEKSRLLGRVISLSPLRNWW